MSEPDVLKDLEEMWPALADKNNRWFTRSDCSAVMLLAAGEIERLRKFARAVLLYHGAPSWTEKEKREWSELTGNRDATTRVLCDLARAVLTASCETPK